MIIGICGFQGSGKDTIADYLCKFYGYTRFSFASVLKDVVSVLFGWDRQMLEGLTPEARLLREKPDEWWSKNLGIPNFTPRYALQFIGTDLFRKHFHNDIWILILKKRLQGLDNIVISDCRYENEIETLYSIGAQLIYVDRNMPEWFNQFKMTKDPIYVPNNIHQSEYDWIKKCPSVKINNNADILNLYKSVDNFMNEYKINVEI